MKRALLLIALAVPGSLAACSSDGPTETGMGGETSVDPGGDPSGLGGSTGTGTLVVGDGGYVVAGPWSGYAEVNVPASIVSISPSSYADLKPGDRLCLSGTTAADYLSTPWLAVNLAQDEGEGTTKGSVSLTEGGLYVNVDNIAGSTLRAQLIGAEGTTWCAPLAVSGGITIPLSNFNTECWSGLGDTYAGEPVTAFSVIAPGDINAEIDFDFCLDDLSPAEIDPNCKDVPPAGSEYSCAAQAGWGKCDETWMTGSCLLSCGRCDEWVEPDPVTIDTVFTTTPNTDAGSHPGYRVTGRHLYDRCGEKVELRGINKMMVWTDQAGDSLPEIAQTGANVVRIVWNTTATTTALDALIQRTIDNEMIPMIELVDATGSWYAGDIEGRLGLSNLVDYWTSDEVVAVIQKYEKDLLVNIGNEVGTVVSLQTYVQGYMDAISRMRDAGIRTPLIIDASGYGQDINRLQEAGPTLFNFDPYNNVLFSVHMWWVPDYHDSTEWPTVKDRVVGELAESVDMGLPLIVGEFAHAGIGCLPGIPYKDIMEQCDAQEVGWLAWSWGPGNSDCEEMDMTSDSTFAGLQSGWATEVATTDTYSIANTAVRPYSIVNGTCAP